MIKHIKKINFKWILVATFWTASAYLLILSGVFVYFSYLEVKNNRTHDDLVQKLRNVENLAFIRNSRDNYGGQTPGEAIYMYYEFLESQQYPLASTIFTKETRGAHLSLLKDISEPAMRRFVEVLRLSEKEAQAAKIEDGRVEIDSPIKIVLKSVDGYAGAPVWQIESIDYRLP